MKTRRSDKQRSAAFEKFNNRASFRQLKVDAMKQDKQHRSILRMMLDKLKVKWWETHTEDSKS